MSTLYSFLWSSHCTTSFKVFVFLCICICIGIWTEHMAKFCYGLCNVVATTCLYQAQTPGHRWVHTSASLQQRFVCLQQGRFVLQNNVFVQFAKYIWVHNEWELRDLLEETVQPLFRVSPVTRMYLSKQRYPSACNIFVQFEKFICLNFK